MRQWFLTTVLAGLGLFGGAVHGQSAAAPNAAPQPDSAAEIAPSPAAVPRCVVFDLRESYSQIGLSLFPGGFSSPLDGRIALELGAQVPVPATGFVGVRARQAYLIAQDYTPDGLLAEPQPFWLSPCVASTGYWNPSTGYFVLTAHFVSPNGIAAPMPIHFFGYLVNGDLVMWGNNGNPPDGSVQMDIWAQRVKLSKEFTFSTETNFSMVVGPTLPSIVTVTHGDLLSSTRCVLATNNELTQHFGFKPIVPDLGLDALTHGEYNPVLFSLEENQFSETMGVLVRHGDLLASDGRIIRTNLELIGGFSPLIGIGQDMGLDAVHVGRDTSTWNGILFSTEDSFYSGALGVTVSHGDLLREDGTIFRTNAQLLQAFDRICPVDGCPDVGLDAVYLPDTFGTEAVPEVWFSVEDGFHAAHWGYISDGDLISSRGYVVQRNLDLLRKCAPLEDLDNFGLDAADFTRVRCRE